MGIDDRARARSRPAPSRACARVAAAHRRPPRRGRRPPRRATSSPPSANSTLTDLGALKVRSKPPPWPGAEPQRPPGPGCRPSSRRGSPPARRDRRAPARRPPRRPSGPAPVARQLLRQVGEVVVGPCRARCRGSRASGPLSLTLPVTGSNGRALEASGRFAAKLHDGDHPAVGRLLVVAEAGRSGPSGRRRAGPAPGPVDRDAPRPRSARHRTRPRPRDGPPGCGTSAGFVGAPALGGEHVERVAFDAAPPEGSPASGPISRPVVVKRTSRCALEGAADRAVVGTEFLDDVAVEIVHRSWRRRYRPRSATCCPTRHSAPAPGGPRRPPGR